LAPKRLIEVIGQIGRQIPNAFKCSYPLKKVAGIDIGKTVVHEGDICPFAKYRISLLEKNIAAKAPAASSILDRLFSLSPMCMVTRPAKPLGWIGCPNPIVKSPPANLLSVPDKPSNKVITPSFDRAFVREYPCYENLGGNTRFSDHQMSQGGLSAPLD
jgi:hypothetical protein